MSDELIGITGATGGVGGRTARRLAEQGAPQRLIVRDPSRAPQLENAHTAQIAGFGDAESMKRALDGVHTLFFVPATEDPDRVEQHRAVVESAVAAGVQRVVDLSVINPSADATFTFVRHHWATEEMWRATGLPLTVLRDSLYLDFVPFMVSAEGVIAGPADDGRVAPVTRDNIADAAAAVLTDASHDGRVYDLTGRERFSLAEAAETMSRFSGKRIVFKNETVEEAYASRANYGADDWIVEGWVTTYVGLAKGEADLVSDDVKRLTGHEPITLVEYLEANPTALDHVTA